MLALAFGLLCAASAIGAGLAILYIQGPRVKPAPAAVPIAHAALGAASLLVLSLTLRRGLPQTGMGTAGFGVMAGGLLVLVLALGLTLAYSAWRRRPAAMLVGTHASLAIAALVLLLTLIALG